jgi:hypothetical protein
MPYGLGIVSLWQREAAEARRGTRRERRAAAAVDDETARKRSKRTVAEPRGEISREGVLAAVSTSTRAW